jgi:hypothetical protein
MYYREECGSNKGTGLTASKRRRVKMGQLQRHLEQRQAANNNNWKLTDL